MSCFCRIIDLEAFNILLDALPQRQYTDVLRRLGWLNTFSPLRPYRSYSLNLRHADERACLSLLLDIASHLGGDLVEDKQLGSDHRVSELYAKQGALPREGWAGLIFKRATAARRSSMMVVAGLDCMPAAALLLPDANNTPALAAATAHRSSTEDAPKVASAIAVFGGLVQQTLVGDQPMREEVTAGIARMDSSRV